MTALFDGVAGALNGVFGAPVTFLPAAGGSSQIRSIFREEPVEMLDDEGRSVLREAATWKVPADLNTGAARGDQIQPGNGKTYRILNRIGTGSPAADGFVVFELEEVTP